MPPLQSDGRGLVRQGARSAVGEDHGARQDDVEHRGKVQELVGSVRVRAGTEQAGHDHAGVPPDLGQHAHEGDGAALALVLHRLAEGGQRGVVQRLAEGRIERFGPPAGSGVTSLEGDLAARLLDGPEYLEQLSQYHLRVGVRWNPDGELAHYLPGDRVALRPLGGIDVDDRERRTERVVDDARDELELGAGERVGDPGEAIEHALLADDLDHPGDLLDILIGHV